MTATTRIMEHIYKVGPIRDIDIKMAMRNPHHSILKQSIEDNHLAALEAEIIMLLGKLKQLRRFLLKKKIKKMLRALKALKAKARRRHFDDLDLTAGDEVNAEIKRAQQELEERLDKIHQLETEIQTHQANIFAITHEIAETETKLLALGAQQESILGQIDQLLSDGADKVLRDLGHLLIEDSRPPVEAIRHHVADESLDWEHPAVQLVAEILHEAVKDRDQALMLPLLKHSLSSTEFHQDQVEHALLALENGEKPVAMNTPREVLHQDLKKQMDFTREIQVIGKLRHRLAPRFANAQAKEQQKLDELENALSCCHENQREHLQAKHQAQAEVVAKHRGMGGIKGMALACRMGQAMVKNNCQESEELHACREQLIDIHQQRQNAVCHLRGLESRLESEYSALNRCEREFNQLQAETQAILEKHPTLAKGFDLECIKSCIPTPTFTSTIGAA